MNLCKFQAQKAFTWGGVLENNINYILEPYLNWDDYLIWDFNYHKSIKGLNLIIFRELSSSHSEKNPKSLLLQPKSSHTPPKYLFHIFWVLCTYRKLLATHVFFLQQKTRSIFTLEMTKKKKCEFFSLKMKVRTS